MKLNWTMYFLIMASMLFDTGGFFAEANTIIQRTKIDGKLNEAIVKLEITTEKAGMSEIEIVNTMDSLKYLVDKGVSVKYALKLIKIAIKQGYNVQEINAITRSINYCICENSKADDCVKICKTCIKKRLRVRELDGIISASKRLLFRDFPIGQIRILLNDLIAEGIRGKVLEGAIRAVGESVEGGFFFRESRREISLIVLNGVREGLISEKLTERIREKREKNLAKRKIISKEYTKRKITTDVKDTLKNYGQKK